MKERIGHQLPSLVNRETICLPDYVTIGWRANGQEYEAEIHPDRVLEVMEDQERILGGLDDWWYVVE